MTLEPSDRRRLLERSREIDDAVEPLWAAGSIAVVLRLLLEDGRRLVDTLSTSTSASVMELEELCREASSLGAPELERELTVAHRELLARLASTRRRAIAELREGAAQRPGLRLLAALVAVLLLAGPMFLLFRNTITARASAVYSRDFPASQAIDGLITTEWLLPQRQTGWLELTFSRPRPVRALIVRNAVNSHYRDRATKSFRVEAFSHAKSVGSGAAEFPSIDAGQGPLEVSLGDAREVTHVRIIIDSFHGDGGGLAEIAVE